MYAAALLGSATILARHRVGRRSKTKIEALSAARIPFRCDLSAKKPCNLMEVFAVPLLDKHLI
jgi:hypothetical protein